MAWVRGHSGVTGNEVADEMAKENTVAVQLSSPALARTGREIKKEIKELLNVNGSNGGKQYHNVELLNHSLLHPPQSTENL